MVPGNEVRARLYIRLSEERRVRGAGIQICALASRGWGRPLSRYTSEINGRAAGGGEKAHPGC